MTVRMEYYTAQWCGHCKNMKPVIAELQAAGWDISKIDVDEQPALASRNGVMAMPTFLFYKDGHVVKRITGARSKAVLENELRILER